MKTLLATLIGAIAIGATLPAFAGPDWQLIEQGRKAKLARMQQAAAAAKVPAPADGEFDMAQTMDPAQHDKMMKECAAMMKNAHQN